MISVDLDNPAVTGILQLAADGDFVGAFDAAKMAVQDDPDNVSLIHLFARLDEIGTTVPPDEQASGVKGVSIPLEKSPAFVCFQAEALALLGRVEDGIRLLDSMIRLYPLIQRTMNQMVSLMGCLAPDDEARYAEMLDVCTLIQRHDLDEVLGSYWVYKHKSPFNYLAAGEKGRVFLASCTFAPYAAGGIACWIPHLPENDYLILTDCGPCSNLPPGFWKALAPEPVRDRVYFLSNEPEVHELRLGAGLNSFLVNNNCWLDENSFSILEGAEKKYDAVYTARAVDMKRIHLAEKVPNLALVQSGINMKSTIPPATGYERCRPVYAPADYLNFEQLTHLYSESRCGLMLSRHEGACYTVTEYMLCGIPAVSTMPDPGDTMGGREAWLSDDNSVYCRPTPAAVAEAVEIINAGNLSPADVRQSQITRMQAYRDTFEHDVLLPLLDKIGYRHDMKTAMRDTVWNETGLICKFRMENRMSPMSEILSLFLDRSIA